MDDDKEKTKKQLYDTLLPLMTSLVDYIILYLFMMVILQGIIRSLRREQNGSVGLIVGTMLGNFLATGLFVVREEIHVWLLGTDRISPYKIRNNPTTTEEKKTTTPSRKNTSSSSPHPYNIPTLMKVIVSSGIIFILLIHYGIVWDEDVEFTYEGWKKIFLPFYQLLVVRDIFFMAPFHTLMHYKAKKPQSSSMLSKVLKWFRKLHYKHHEVGKSAQSLHAYHIDDLDLFIENLGAPILFSCLQYMLGMYRIGVSMNTLVLLNLNDVGLHSVNPFSIMYFNPILDAMLYPNICHHLHHTPKYQNTYICFTPYHHLLLSPHLKRVDMRRYDENFKTNFFTTT
mmetsp:Transcript_42918/g.49480  ORF Transcript_42918/g.49480 Transcript_42918/m.49480 type:complete len:341 (-) Transcript_42918:174-1196(-)